MTALKLKLSRHATPSDGTGSTSCAGLAHVTRLTPGTAMTVCVSRSSVLPDLQCRHVRQRACLREQRPQPVLGLRPDGVGVARRVFDGPVNHAGYGARPLHQPVVVDGRVRSYGRPHLVQQGRRGQHVRAPHHNIHRALAARMMVKDGNGGHARNGQGPGHIGVFCAAVVRLPLQGVPLPQLRVRFLVRPFLRQPPGGIRHPGNACNRRRQFAYLPGAGVGRRPVVLRFHRHVHKVRPGGQYGHGLRAVAVNPPRAVRQRAHDAPGGDGDVRLQTSLRGPQKAHLSPRLRRRPAGKIHAGRVHIQPFSRGTGRRRLRQKTLKQAVNLPVAPAENFQQAANHAFVQVQPRGQIPPRCKAVLRGFHIPEHGGPDLLNRSGNTR